MCCVKVRSPNVQTFFSAHAHLDARSLARRTIGPCASCMPKRPTADTNDRSFFGGKKAKTLDDDLRELSGKIVKAAEEGKTELVAELKQQQAALERREAEHKQQQAEHKQQLAKAAYEKAKAAYDKMQKPGPKKDAAEKAMDQAHAVYLALLGACLYRGRN